MPSPEHVDVVILGGGLAGQSLARQLLLETAETVLLLDKRAELPAPNQKVGEATVQVSGYYFSKVLDLEEHLLCEHFMKYNLRFYWKSAGLPNDGFEQLGQSYPRPLSNIASYQLDRNKIEAELFARNLADSRFTFCPQAVSLDVELAKEGPHTVRFDTPDGPREVAARWVVDCSGRARILARKLGLGRPGNIRHGSVFLWVEGLVNIEKLTGLSRTEMLRHPSRSALGHLPFWLATNHFVGEGFWVWVIPLQGKTSIGLVFDREMIDHRSVSSAEKMIDWICKEFPLFARDLPTRKVLDFGGIPDYGYDCAQTLSPERWALAGMAGRFSDPLYSPGGDLISIYNTVIVDAIATRDPELLAAKVRAYESLMRAVYESYVPGFAESYNVLGDQEAYSLKYTWELAVYFAFLTFPFINGFFTDRRFLLSFFNRFNRLGPLNRSVMRFTSAYARWAKDHLEAPAEPIFLDFFELAPLARAEKTFYKVGITVDEGKEVLGEQLANFEEFCRYILAYLSSVVVGDAEALSHPGFVAAIDITDYPFDPEAIRQRWAAAGPPAGRHEWSFDTCPMERFRAARGFKAARGSKAALAMEELVPA